MRYADPQSCPSCRGPIGGVSTCPDCGFDLTSPQARQLWDVFVQADQIIAHAQRARDARIGTDQSVPVSASTSTVSATPATAVVTAAAPVAAQQTPSASRVQLTPGAILLGLGALSLVVAATIFVSLSWGRLGIGGRAAILLLLTCAFATGLWFALKRKLPATSEALAFVVLAMVTINIFAAVSEGLFGLDRLHWGYPILLWTGFILILSYWIQSSSEEALSRSLYSVQVILGVAVIPASIASASLVTEFWADHEAWTFIAGLPFLLLFLTFTHHLSQQISWWICLVWSVLWLIPTTVFAWLVVADTYLIVGVSGYAAMVVLMLCGVAAAYRYPRFAAWAMAYALVNLAYLIAVVLATHLDFFYHLNELTQWLLFLGFFVALLAIAARAVKTSSDILRWITALVSAALLVAWSIPVLVFLADPTHMPDSYVTNGQDALWMSAVAVLLATATLIAVSLQLTRWFEPMLTALPRQIVPASAALILSLGLAAALGVLSAPLLLIAAIFLLGSITIVWLASEDSPWQLLGAIPALLVIQLLSEPNWIFLVMLTSLAFTSAGIAWLLTVKLSADESATQLAPVLSFAALGTWSGVYALWHLPSVVGAVMSQPYLYLALLVAGVAVASLGLMGYEAPRIGAELGAAILAVLALTGLVEHPASFALAAISLSAACAIVALVDRRRRWQFALAAGLAIAAWTAQLIAWDIQIVEAYTAPIAVVLLLIGLGAMKQYESLNTTLALGAGLVLAFVPSLPDVLSEPASLRALLWGIAAGISLTIGLVLRWLAPVVAGGVALLIVMLANVGPIVLDLDRWILFGVLGAVLLAGGIRWEQNVIGGKALLIRLAQMR